MFFLVDSPMVNSYEYYRYIKKQLFHNIWHNTCIYYQYYHNIFTFIIVELQFGRKYHEKYQYVYPVCRYIYRIYRVLYIG